MGHVASTMTVCVLALKWKKDFKTSFLSCKRSPWLFSFRFETIQQELSKATAQNKELQREMERLQSEATRYKTVQLKAAKDAEKYKEERDSVFSEYRLIMSERDQVIKEVDKLQTELELAESKLKNTSSEKKVASEEMEALRQVWNWKTLLWVEEVKSLCFCYSLVQSYLWICLSKEPIQLFACRSMNLSKEYLQGDQLI